MLQVVKLMRFDEKAMGCFCELQKALSSAFNFKTLCCISSVPSGGTPTMQRVEVRKTSARASSNVSVAASIGS